MPSFPSFPGLQDYFKDDDVLYKDYPWVVLSKDKLAGYMMQDAIIGHKCDSFDVVQFMDEEDCIRGECWWCKEVIPDGVQFIWQMLNWDKMPDMKRYEEKLPQQLLFEKNHTQVGAATYGNNPIKTSCIRNEEAYKPKKTCSRVGSWAPFNKNQTNIHKPMKDKKQSIVGRHTAP